MIGSNWPLALPVNARSLAAGGCCLAALFAGDLLSAAEPPKPSLIQQYLQAKTGVADSPAISASEAEAAESTPASASDKSEVAPGEIPFVEARPIQSAAAGASPILPIAKAAQPDDESGLPPIVTPDMLAPPARRAPRASRTPLPELAPPRAAPAMLRPQPLT
ncbi:MAG TPA: hypothetical protein VFV87_13470, partial [Pirellulaceae bacterium]|nr:hypothetical protein [Pirellulaceae bacterium]